MHTRALAIAVTTLAFLALVSGCAPSQTHDSLVVPLADIQLATVTVKLGQVVKVDTGDSRARYSADVADESVVSVVQRREPEAGRFEPEIVPLEIGNTEIVLRSSDPDQTVVGFRVVVTE